ncbi:MAG: methyltransferase domain-containing protein, partial [Acidobacteria bacterium]|nr:methyltransferase domain-containing protein [Acidobacteriota bacterium]
MATLSHQMQALPRFDRVFRAMHGFTHTAALETAVELDLFTAIAEGNTDVGSIASRCRASERGVRSLCDFLTVEGFLVKNDSRYALAAESAAYLDRNSPSYLGSAVQFLHSTLLVDAFNRLTDAVRKGGTAITDHGAMEPNHPIWENFARSMAPLMIYPAERIAALLNADAGERWKVLDIAAGHGLFGITLARHNPNAHIYAVDWQRVLAVARENAEKAGVAARFHALEGNAFEVPFAPDHDVVLLTNFLHHFDIPTCESLLRKVRGALKPCGRVAVLEFVPTPDRVSPPPA